MKKYADREPMMNLGRRYHLLFALSLLALAALAIWWTVFVKRAVELERDFRLHTIDVAAAQEAARLGRGENPPSSLDLSDNEDLELVVFDGSGAPPNGHPCFPNHPQVVVRPSHQALAAIEEKLFRRQVMWVGESGLLFILIGVCTFMLYWIVNQERQFRNRMEAFVSTVTHEMKTPLTGIVSFLQTLAAGRIPESQQTRLSWMGLREAERLEHMIENVLLSGRLRIKDLQLAPQWVELEPFMNQFLEHRRQYLVDRPERIRLVLDTAPDRIKIWADANALRTILDNLADNAFKYGGDRPVLLRVSEGPTRICISVEDQGVGFDSRRCKELFRPFYQDGSASEGVMHGTGLGLTIASALASRMNAELEAHSRGPGCGSRFSLTFAKNAS